MKSNSKIVTSNQVDVHEDLIEILERNQNSSYFRPIAEHSKQTFSELLNWIQNDSNKQIILDMGCGTGESSYHLAMQNPTKLIIGIDKSLDRLERNNEFKRSLPANMKLVRGELLDLWYLFYLNKDELNIYKQYILYPNPWPKKKLVKRRFHANPIFPFLIQVAPRGELRTNWKIYACEFQVACEYLGLKQNQLELYQTDQPLTAFELKYTQSHHQLYRFCWSY